MAQAVKNSGGIVIAQVEFLAQKNTIHPKEVRVPGILIDYIVPANPKNHMQTGGIYYNPGISGEYRVPLADVHPLPFDERKVMVRRAAMELRPNAVVNLGIGTPAGVGSVAAEEGISDMFTFTTELGAIGGVPLSPPNFSVSGPIRRPSLLMRLSSTIMMEAVWIWPSWGWPRQMWKAI